MPAKPRCMSVRVMLVPVEELNVQTDGVVVGVSVKVRPSASGVVVVLLLPFGSGTAEDGRRRLL